MCPHLTGKLAVQEIFNEANLALREKTALKLKTTDLTRHIGFFRVEVYANLAVRVLSDKF